MREWLNTWPSWLYDATAGEFTVVGKILLSMAVILASYFVIRFITFLIKRAFGMHKNGIAIDRSARSFFLQTVRILLWLLVAFLVIQILGIDLTSFAGILSAITVALGLSLQDIITCFASGLIILNQGHILTGEYISIKSDIGEAEGFVQKISLMSTTIKTYDGQFITVSNANVRKAILTNYSRNKIRRVYFTIPVSYDADPDLVKKVLHKIVKDDKRFLTDPEPYIHYELLDDFAVRVAIKVWTTFDDYWPAYNDLHEKIVLAFKKNHIKIPKVTTLHVAKD